MANYSVEAWTGTITGSIHGSLLGLRNMINTLADTQTIRAVGLVDVGNGKYWTSYMVYES